MTLLTHAHRSNESTGSRVAKWADRVVGINYQKFCPGEAWVPSMNFYEDSEQYFLVVDLAGVKGQDIDIRVDAKRMMVLAGQRAMPEMPEPCGEVRLHLMEIDHGTFCRTIDLPDDADVDGIKATYRTGFLWVRVPKK